MKMYRLLLINLILIFTGFASYAQKFQIKSSVTSFYSQAPLEDIEASTKETKGILDSDAKTFFFKVPIKSFVFNSELMRDHFNENYMESEKYPNAIFKGKINGPFNLSVDGSYPVVAVGEINMHGVKNNVSIPSVILVKNGTPSVESTFMIKLKDYKIDIPTVVFNKIAEEVEVKIAAVLDKIN